LLAAPRVTDAVLLPDQPGNSVVDVGSGSIQVSVYDKGQFIFSQNMLLGSLRIRDLLADLERRTADFAGLMEEYIASDLDNTACWNRKASCTRPGHPGRRTALPQEAGGLDPEANAVSARSRWTAWFQLLLSERRLTWVPKQDSGEHATLLLPTALILRKFVPTPESNRCSCRPRPLRRRP
jgi:exopolyphosphatase/guanosine-5'-triphosphate,3'-diphosphate pyrophosphatase